MLTTTLTYSSPWDIHTHTADVVGDRLALFALGSLISMANLNPLIPIIGDVPYLGHSLVTYEPWFTIIWVCIVGAHLAVTAATVIAGWRAKQGMPDQEMDRMDNRRAEEGDELREHLVKGQSEGEDTENGGSVRSGGEHRHNERRSIEDQEIARQQGLDFV